MDSNRVYFKDARQMSEVDDNSVALVVTSPPYWNVKDYSLDGHQREQTSAPHLDQLGDIGAFGTYIDQLLTVWRECERVLRPNGKLAVNTPLMPIPKKDLNTHYTRDIFDINAAIQQSIVHKTGLFLYDVWIWNRANPTKKLMFGSYPYPPNFYAQNTVEFISVFVKDGPPPKLPPETKQASALTEAEWVEYTRQVWEIPIPNRGDPAYGKHPAIMPEEIARRFIRLFTFSGDLVLDPFLGSGTTAKAAESLGRRWVGYEVNEKYAELIEEKVPPRPRST
jgi:site-specific DNA-methyltransferase (cytosine-N4-specific)